MAGSIVLLAFLVTGCNKLPSRPAAPSESGIQGIAFVDWSANGHSSGAADNSMSELALTGANTAAILITAYQDEPGSKTLRPSDPRTPTRAAVLHAIDEATRYPVGLLLGLELLASRTVALRVDYRFRRVLADPVADFDEHELRLGVSLLLNSRPADGAR